jgi:two-component system phosphate regulon sensor histidine kinase PhoR
MAFVFLDLTSKQIFQFSIFNFFSILIFSYILLFHRFESLIIFRLNEIYKKLSPTSSLTSEIKKTSDIDLFTSNIKKINSDKNLEIEMLKNQENYRKEFIGNIAHELKTPLFTIQGYILTLLDGGVTDKEIIKKYLKRTSKGVERLTYVVKDLDLITKFESGMANLELKTFDILFTIKNVFELLEMRAKKNNIKLKINNEYVKPIYVYADEERIQQVITNLIINSLKYGVDRGVTEVSIDSLKKGKILIRISDNGEGIEKKHLPRLFERFYRVEKTRNRTLGGSGLGLSIVKHIIDAHNEKIFVESQVNIGSEFSFTLSKSNKTQLIQE